MCCCRPHFPKSSCQNETNDTIAVAFYVDIIVHFIELQRKNMSASTANTS